MKSKKIFNLILLLILSIFTFYRLLRPGYFSMMDDMHVFRLQQFDQCLKDGQIPCRFITNGGLGYGYPLFNYYPPLSYSIAEIFHLTGFSLINSLKITFAISHIIGLLGMYLFANLFWGEIGGIISAILFLFAPYQATNAFVRGDIAELLAINIIPWVFYFLTKFINQNKNKLGLIFSLSALLLTHNLISLTIAPILLTYSLFLLLKNKKLKINSIIKLSIPVLFSIGLSAFFILPALFEKNLVTVETMTQGYFYYVNHFATLKQLFISRFWGYGASLWGPIDDMAFSVGIAQWILPLVAIILFLFKRNKKYFPLIILFSLISLFSLFLTHNKSTFIWKILPFMAYYQFPWRFLSVAIFTLSFISGSIVLFIKKKFQIFLLTIIIISTLLLNFSYFKEDIWYSNLTDNQELSQDRLIAQSGAGLKDYWPKFGQNFPTSFAPNQPTASNNININYFYKNSRQVNLIANVDSDGTIIIPLVYFPNWYLTIDGQPSEIKIDPDLGLIKFDVQKGNHTIFLEFKNTPIRNITNTISLVSLFLIIILVLKPKFKNEK
ncbi:MAG: 6-pyruvoyl-tetrahydropterin synthase-related protein [Candidatus Shapirobacteria bacterium]|nr:6-pyruvoyl-tetrahydropterin synthase-related protein [Candidatus Shapirobacteria bacterium]